MLDYFSLLDEPRRPWLDPDLLKKKFLSLSANVHPDRVHAADQETKRKAQSRYAELNEAYNHVRSPKQRLQHLLELETGRKPPQIQQVPPHLLDFFMDAGRLFKKVDAFLAEKEKTSSPLLQVAQFEVGQAWTEKLNSLQQKLNATHQNLLAALKGLDEKWGEADLTAKADVLIKLEELWRLFSYVTRWESQIQERIVQLSL